MFYVDIRDTSMYTFYYNVNKEINNAVVNAVGQDIKGLVPRDKNTFDLGKMTAYNAQTQELEVINAADMVGICASVSVELAKEIVERAKYYCPVDTGLLRDSFRIEDLGNGKAMIYNDCPYAWYVEEFTWKNHKYPTRAKFLELAIRDVEAKYGFGWYTGGTI